MAMIYTLVTSAKDWLVEKFSHDAEDEEPKEKDAVKDDVWLFALPLTFSAQWSCVFYIEGVISLDIGAVF